MGTRTGTTNPLQSGPGSNGDEGVLHIHQAFRTGASPSGGLVSYLGHSLGRVYNPSRQDSMCMDEYI